MTTPAVAGPGAGTITGGTPIIPGAPGPTGEVGPIVMSLRGEPESYSAAGTAVVSGTLAFAGADYLVVRVPVGAACRDLVIPYNAVGMILVAGPPL